MYAYITVLAIYLYDLMSQIFAVDLGLYLFLVLYHWYTVRVGIYLCDEGENIVSYFLNLFYC